MTITSKDNELLPFVYSDGDKSQSIEFDAKTVALLESTTIIENNKDLDSHWLKEIEHKELIGIFEYDSLALFQDESVESTIVTEDNCIANIIYNATDVNSTPCGIFDLLIYLDVGIDIFVNALIKIKGYKFSIPLTINSIEYITNRMLEIKDKTKVDDLFDKLNSFFELTDDRLFNTFIVENAVFLLTVIGNPKNPVQITISEYLYRKLFEVCAPYLTVTKTPEPTVFESEINKDGESLYINRKEDTSE